MSRLTRFLFPAPAPRSTRAIIAWWERRRLGYNLVVGGAGLVTLAVVQLLAVLPPDGSAELVDSQVLVGVAAYAVLANLCYTFGWVVEAAMHLAWGDRVLPVGGPLFRQGVVFSVGLTLLPIVLAQLFWCVRFVAWLVR